MSNRSTGREQRVGALVVAALALAATACEPPPPVPTTEWEAAQLRYARALDDAGLDAPILPSLQLLEPRHGGEAEACVSCHLGMAPWLPAIGGERLFRAHPKLAHPVEDLGCISCHGGGAGLSRAEAHGEAVGSPTALLPLSLVESRCGSCHARLAPEVGSTGAPTLAAGRAAFEASGCLGCHRVGDVGARLARDLSQVGASSSGLLAFGAELRANSPWSKLLWHYGDPLVVAPVGLVEPMSGEQARRLRELQTYLLSLDTAEAPVSDRGFADDGASLHAALCSACHGADARGLHWAGRSQDVPGLVAGHASLVSERYLRESIANGRPRRGMPAWRADRAGLTEDEIDRLVSWLIAQRPQAPELATLETRGGNVRRGLAVYTERCASCHGSDGRGGAFGGDLRGLNAQRLHEGMTSGRPDAGMPPFAGLPSRELADLLALLASSDPWSVQADERAGGPRPAETLYSQACASCHGAQGEGRGAPSLASAEYQEAATDAMITMAILVGQPGARVPGWEHAGSNPLSAREALALTAHVRSLRER